jgi:hypothetical protein
LGRFIQIVDGHLEVENVFGAEHVTSFRKGLYSQLTSTSKVTWDFLCSFFPCLCRESTTFQYAVIPLVHGEKESARQSQESTGNNFDRSNNTNKVVDNLVNDAELVVEKEDTFLTVMFMKQQKQYDTLAQLHVDMDVYEKWEGTRLIIKNSDAHSRIYRGGTHINCCFKWKTSEATNSQEVSLSS